MDWPKDKQPSIGKPLADAQIRVWDAEVGVAVKEIEARVGPHPGTPEYRVWLQKKGPCDAN